MYRNHDFVLIMNNFTYRFAFDVNFILAYAHTYNVCIMRTYYLRRIIKTGDLFFFLFKKPGPNKNNSIRGTIRYKHE